jgi:hypothetical protein
MPFINVTVCAAKSAGRCGSRLLAPRRNSARLSVAGGSLMRLVRARLASTSVCVNVSKSSSETLANRCRHTATNDSSAPFANRELNETRNDSGVTVEVNIRAYAVHSVSVASLYSLACAPKNRRSASSERCVSPSDSILLPQSAHDSAAGLFLAALCEAPILDGARGVFTRQSVNVLRRPLPRRRCGRAGRKQDSHNQAENADRFALFHACPLRVRFIGGIMPERRFRREWLGVDPWAGRRAEQVHAC